MKKSIVAAILTISCISAFACSPEKVSAHDQKHEKYVKMHTAVINSMSPTEKTNYDKISNMVDGLSMQDKKALALKLKHDFMMMSPEQKAKLRQEHKEHIKAAKELLSKEKTVAPALPTASKTSP